MSIFSLLELALIVILALLLIFEQQLRATHGNLALQGWCV